jgi:hypothetical protein
VAEGDVVEQLAPAAEPVGLLEVEDRLFVACVRGRGARSLEGRDRLGLALGGGEARKKRHGEDQEEAHDDLTG